MDSRPRRRRPAHEKRTVRKSTDLSAARTLSQERLDGDFLRAEGDRVPHAVAGAFSHSDRALFATAMRTHTEAVHRSQRRAPRPRRPRRKDDDPRSMHMHGFRAAAIDASARRADTSGGESERKEIREPYTSGVPWRA